MIQVLNVILPVFSLIGLGFFMVKRGMFSQNGVNDLTRFIFYLAVPSLLFRTSSSGVLHQRLEPGILLAYFTMGIGILFLSYFLLRKPIGHDRATVGGISACFGNLVLVGLPIVQTAYPPEALAPMMTLITFNAMILFTLSCVIMETGRQGRVNIVQIVKGALKSVLTNPLVIALCSGLVVAEAGWQLPYIVDRVTELLGKAAPAVALFAVGGGMARYSLKLGDTRLPVLLATFAKLVIMPLGVWLICHFIIHTSALWTIIATLGASMPAGANPFVFATRYQVGDRIAGNTILLTAALSLFTISALLYFFPAP